MLIKTLNNDKFIPIDANYKGKKTYEMTIDERVEWLKELSRLKELAKDEPMFDLPTRL